MKNIDLIPKVRFPEFEGEWKTGLLKEDALFLKGKGLSKKDIAEDGRLPCIRYAELYTLYDEIISEVQSRTNVDSSELELSQANDVIIPASGEDRYDIATASCVMMNGVGLSGDLNIIRTKLNGPFLAYYLNSAAKAKIAKLAQGVSVVHLYKSQLKELSLNLPLLPEQQKIATFLSLVDRRLAAARQKVALLEKYKKGVMQKIFSQKIRFKDDLGQDFPVWEERKLGDVCILKNGYAFKSSSYVASGKHMIITIANVQNGFLEKTNYNCIDQLPHDIQEHQMLEKGDLLISLTGNVGRVALVNSDNCLLNQRVGKLVPESINSEFLFQALRSYGFINKMISRAQGGAQANLRKRDIDLYDIFLPLLPEQQKVASILTTIDARITATQKEITGWETWKKGLLQKMLV